MKGELTMSSGDSHSRS